MWRSSASTPFRRLGGMGVDALMAEYYIEQVAKMPKYGLVVSVLPLAIIRCNPPDIPIEKWSEILRVKLIRFVIP